MIILGKVILKTNLRKSYS